MNPTTNLARCGQLPRPALASNAAPSRRQLRIPHIAMVVEAAGGGVAVHLADLVKGIRTRANAHIHLIAPLGDRYDTSTLSPVLMHCASFHQLPLHRAIGLHDLRAAFALRRLLHQLRPDVVHSHSSKAGALARLCPGPWKQVYTPHAVYTLNPTLPAMKRRFYAGVERFLGNHCTDAVIAVSSAEANHLGGLGIRREHVRTVVNGVAAPDLLPPAVARAALGVSEKAFVIGFVGRFDMQKGVDRLVRIARCLHRRYGDRLQIVAIGSGDFRLAAGEQANDMPPNLHVAGRVANAQRYFSAFDLFALPSRYEGFPYVCIEALCAHVPMVATRVAGATELIDQHDVGLIVPNEDDPDAFAQAVSAFVDRDDLRARTRSRCIRAAEHFTVAKMVDDTLAVYRDLLGEGAL